jgi:hypothetical protein
MFRVPYRIGTIRQLYIAIQPNINNDDGVSHVRMHMARWVVVRKD